VYLESIERIATCPSEYQLSCPDSETGPDPNPDVLSEEGGQLAVKTDGPALEEEHPPISTAARVPAIAGPAIRRIP
jgi:hypothetical protein